MSDRFEQSDDNTDRVAGKSMKASQSAWMAHWGSTSYKPGTQTHTLLDIELKEDYDDIKKHHLSDVTEMETGDSVFSKGCREASEGKRVNNGMKHSPQFPLFKFAQQRDSVLALNNLATYTRGELLKSQIDLNHGFKSISPTESDIPSLFAQAHHDTGTSRDCYTMPYYPEKHLKSPKFFETGALASTYIQDDVGSSSKIVPHRYDTKRPQMPREEEGNKATPIIASQEHCQNNNNFSTFHIHEKKVNNNLDFTRSGTSFLKRKDVPLLYDDPLLSDNKLPVFGGEQFEKMQHSSGRKPQSAKDPDIMSIHSTFGPKNGEPAKFSQTTQNFPIKNKTDLNLSGGGQRSRDSPFSSKLKGKMFSEFFHLSSDFSFNGHQGVNMEPIGSSADGFGKNNVGHVKTSAVCIRNESSAETDTMNMDDLQKKHTFSVDSSSSNKKIKATQTSTTSETADALPRDELAGLLNAELPDINQEPPIVGERPSSINDMETSTSRTQSLDVECLLSNAEQLTSSKSADSGGFPSIEEFGSRWVKRLRRSASGSFGHGTKRLKASSHEEKSSCKSVKCSKSNSEPSSPEIYGNTLMTLRPTANVLNNGAVALSGSTERGHYVTPLHYWIRRWCHNDVASQQKSPEASEICETQNPEGTVYPFRKTQLPSIGAMALMGKALNGFTPCEVEKRGSLLVWNTKGL